MYSEPTSARDVHNTDFPKSKHYLWDKTSTGQATFLHIAHYRKPKICTPEKVLRLIQHQCEHFDQVEHKLIGSLIVEDDGEGVLIQIDRLETRTHLSQDSSVPGELIVPFKVTNNTVKETRWTAEDYVTAFQSLQERCCSKSNIELSNYLMVGGWATFYSNAHTSVVHLDFDMVSFETTFKATPIPSIPIVLTALSKNLAGPKNISKVQGIPKTGYLTMDHTRKILLILESDPKAASLPLVGIWISGVEFVQHPFVWASCLRYIHNSFLQDRVNLPPEGFLLVFYTTLHSKPEFYQCNTVSGTKDLNFRLFSGHEVTHIAKAFSSPCDNMTEVDMGSASSQNKLEIFDAAKTQHKHHRFRTNHVTGISEDIYEPRSAPALQMENYVPSFHPVVPDVSVLWSDSLAAPSQSVMNNQRFSVHPSPVVSQDGHFLRPSISQVPKGPPVPVNVPLAQHYSPVSLVHLANSSHSPFSHNVGPAINSHMSLNSQSRNTYPTWQDTRAASTAHSPSYCLGSCCHHHGPTSSVPTNNILPNVVKGKELPLTELQKVGVSQPNTLIFTTASSTPQSDTISCHTNDKFSQASQASSSVVKNRLTQPPALKTVIEESVAQPIDFSQDKIFGLSGSDSSASEDSGLSATPDKHLTQLKQTVSSEGPFSGAQSCDKSAWDQIPADIRTLLIHQNEQIKQLQQQIQMLLELQANQSVQANSVQSTSGTRLETFQGNRSDQNITESSYLPRSSNLSQDDIPPNTNKTHHNTSQSSKDQEKHIQNNKTPSLKLSQDNGLFTPLQDYRPAESSIQAADVLVMQSQPSPDSNEPEANRDVSILPASGLIVNFPLSDDSINHSSSFEPSIPQRSQLDQSPVSVSQYSLNDQDESYSTLAEDATDPKQYYDQLMNNIQRFLTNTASMESETCEEQTYQMSSSNTNGSLAQQLSCMSMLLGCGGDVGQSMEINAMAMKYLNDEQLTHMAKLWKDNGYNTNQSNKVLQKMFSGALSAQDMSLWNSSPNMTMGTQMYLARHGLLGNDSLVLTSSNTDQCSMLETFQLKTDFSTMTIGSQGSGRKFSNDTSELEVSKRARGQMTPLRQEVTSCDKTPAQGEANLPLNNENWLPLKSVGYHKNNGASPMLGIKQHGDLGLHNVLQEVKVIQDSSKKRPSTVSTLSEEEENLLDIAKLKQLPKLL
ncbi:hypothetical protein Btru_037682 [Bulinus truncatus]|nr:hypothetical protein Btru_037682 [Bulinus truncatus]